MSSSVRRHRRERARRAGAVIIKCHVCGREGPRRSMVHREQRWVCRRIPQCMERVFNPPPEPPRVGWPRGGWTMVDLEWLRGFKPLGYISDEGVQHYTANSVSGVIPLISRDNASS